MIAVTVRFSVAEKGQDLEGRKQKLSRLALVLNLKGEK